MAGTIELTAGTRWSVPSWAFNVAVEYLIEKLAGDPAAEVLKEIDENNLGWVGVDRFEVAQRIRILTLLRDGLLPYAEQRIQLDPADPNDGIGRVRELSELAGSTLEQTSKG